jgi:hypothetical protein
MLRQYRDFSTIDAGKRVRGTTEAGKNSVIYMGLISGSNKADYTCGKTTGTMEQGSTVLDIRCVFHFRPPRLLCNGYWITNEIISVNLSRIYLCRQKDPVTFY